MHKFISIVKKKKGRWFILEYLNKLQIVWNITYIV